MSKKQPEQPVRGRSNKVKIFSCALILVAAVFIGIFINGVTAGSRFENEISAINIAFASNNTKKVDEILDRTVSSGSYAKVERSLKKYVRDLVDNINDINAVAENDVVYSSLEAKYLGENKERLGETISSLTESLKKVNALSTDAEKLYNESDVMNYIEGQDLNEDYRKIFTDNAKAFYGDSDLSANYKNTLKLLKGSIAVEIEAVSFLNERKNDWYVENDELNFKSEDLRNQYIKVLEKVAEN